MSPHARLASLATCTCVWMLTACASPTPPPTLAGRSIPEATQPPDRGARAAREATSMIGTPYRPGGSSPGGFDCSGLVVYSYARVGITGLPHSAAALEERVRPVSLAELVPGDLLYFQLDGKKTSHVGIYVGGDAFVHAPSRGKRVERVGFDHVYWGPRVRIAGRLAP